MHMYSVQICFGPAWIDDVLSTALHGLALLLEFGIGLTACYQSNQLEKEHRGLRAVFFTGIVSSCVCSVGGIARNVLCLVAGYYVKWAMVFISFVGYCMLLQCILMVFILRLDVTFQDSPFELSAVKRTIMRSWSVIIQLLWIIGFTISALKIFASNRY